MPAAPTPATGPTWLRPMDRRARSPGGAAAAFMFWGWRGRRRCDRALVADGTGIGRAAESVAATAGLAAAGPIIDPPDASRGGRGQGGAVVC